MSYQIPAVVRERRLLGTGTIGVYLYTPTQDVKFKHLVITMFLRGLMANEFGMRINVYFDNLGRKKLLSSYDVMNSQIVRTGDYYCELRFDFPTLKNLLMIGHQYYVEFELFGDYPMNEENYIGLIIDHDSQLAILNEDASIIRYSDFYDKA